MRHLKAPYKEYRCGILRRLKRSTGTASPTPMASLGKELSIGILASCESDVLTIGDS